MCILIFCSSYEVRSLIACRVLVCRGSLGALPMIYDTNVELLFSWNWKLSIEHINITYLSVANRYRFMREEGTDECTQGE